MPNYNDLIYTSADFKIVLSITGGGAYSLLTVEELSQNISKEEELIYAVSQQNAIGNKQNAKKITGKLAMQLGEMNAILLLEGLPDATEITNATIAVAAIVGGFQRTYQNVNINTESFNIKAKDKQTVVSTDWNCLVN